MNNLSVIILTYNEELNLDRCLKSIIPLNADIYIIDSFSNDKTLEIAKKYNCNILQNKFINHSNQVNWAINNINFNSEWILRLDSDEYITVELLDELKNRLSLVPEKFSGIFLKRRVYFLEKWIRFGGYYPTRLLRIWRNGHALCEERMMDEHIKLIRGDSFQFNNDFIDYNLKNLHWWINKHNNYATKEAIEYIKYKYDLSMDNEIKSKFFGTQEKRKRWFKKNIYNSMPLFFRSFIYFFYRYFIRFGFLDGIRGLIFHFLQGFWYRFLVDVKIYEILKKSKKNKVLMIEIIKSQYNIKL